MAETPPVYEARCPRCDCSFAPETKRCIHCGARLSRGGRATLLAAMPDLEEAFEGAAEEAQEPRRSAAGQLGVAIVSVAIMLGMMLMRLCSGGAG